jgi:hypothetical protein
MYNKTKSIAPATFAGTWWYYQRLHDLLVRKDKEYIDGSIRKYRDALKCIFKNLS